MTRPRNITRDTPYIDWLRNNPDLDSIGYGFDREDIDIVWFQYKSGKMMIIEEKALNASPSPAEKDTHGILHQALKYACPRLHFIRYFPGRTTRVDYYGYHLVQFERFGPLDGGISIDHVSSTIDDLLLFHQFLKFPKDQLVYAHGGRFWHENQP